MISFGQDNGMIKAIDIKSSHKIKYNFKHHERKITKIVTGRNWLISCDSECNVAIFDWLRQQLVQTLNLSSEVIKG